MDAAIVGKVNAPQEKWLKQAAVIVEL